MHIVMLIATVAAAVIGLASPSSADVVQYMGSLMIGFGDSDNATDISNNAVPICAHTGPNPFAPQTFGSLPVYGRAEQTAAGGLTFSGQGRGNGAQAGSGNGGAAIKVAATCQVAIPPFANPRFRSRTQIGAARWPSLIGPFGGSGTTPTPSTPPTYMIGPSQGNDFAGSALVTLMPFLTNNGRVTITKGVNAFGGAIPFQGGVGIQLGLQSSSSSPPVPLSLLTFGVRSYVNGFLPFGPQLFGTDAKGIFTASTTGSNISFPNGAWVSQAGTVALRTPGGTTIDQQGAIQTLLGGNTETQSCPSPIPCAGQKLTSPARYDGAYFEWTTGRVRHTDMVGDYVTMRTATGFDVPVPLVGTPGPDPVQTTRRIQLVSPWSASIKLVGPFGFPVPDLGFGGVAVLSLNILPAPEPGSLTLWSVGIAGLLTLTMLNRRRKPFQLFDSRR